MNERGPEHDRLLECLPIVIEQAVKRQQAEAHLLLIAVIEGRVIEVVEKGAPVFNPQDLDGNPINQIELQPGDEWKVDALYEDADDDRVLVHYEVGDDVVTQRYAGKQFAPLLLPEEGDRVINVFLQLHLDTLLSHQDIWNVLQEIRDALQWLPDISILVQDTQNMEVDADGNKLTYERNGEMGIFEHAITVALPPPGTPIHTFSYLLSAPYSQEQEEV